MRLPQYQTSVQTPPDPRPDRGSGDTPAPSGGPNPARAPAHPLSSRAARPPIRSLYIHTPFCSHKCHYCDFYSFVDTRDQQQAFVDRLLDELRTLAPHAAGAPLRTIFVGGGTPSLLRVDLWRRLLEALGKLFDLSAIRRGEGEFTVECNPETTSAELCAVLRAGGVDRVSIGAQSFDARHLKTLERWHDPENVARALETARAAAIPRQSIDLIFGIPGQTLDEWTNDLDRAISLGTTHLSCYALTYEPNTAMTQRLRMGEFTRLDEDLEADMFTLTRERLRSIGLMPYEISNFAKAGHESLHNLAYWRQEQWLAAGPSASGHAFAGPTSAAGSWRWKNIARLGDYLASGAGFAPVTDVEAPDAMRLARERIMMGLRLAEGLDARTLLADVASISPDGAARVQRGARRAAERGLMEFSERTGRWTLSELGVAMCDGVAADLMRCIPSA